MSRIDELIQGNLEVVDGGVRIINNTFLESSEWDELAWHAVFSEGEEKKRARHIIWETSQTIGCKPSSINDLYFARGRGDIPPNFTVPAMNLRGMAYDMARAVFRVAKRLNSGAFIVEIARSEMGYTDQRPEEFATVMLAGAVREGYRGPIFIQGDHFQAKAESPGVPKAGEIESIKSLATDAMQAGFYNIDIDMSTLVDLKKDSVGMQQRPNIIYSFELARHVRSLQPNGITISLGGEIGHIGGKNSTVDDFKTYMDGLLSNWETDKPCLSKVSVQTGTHHGGVVLPDGSLANIDVDFSVLTDIGRVARSDYGMGGAVQHGASTLPDDYFAHFPSAEALEIHLATGFQNLMMDHTSFPKGILDEMYAWIDQEKKEERGEGWSDEQFHYKLRKKAWGRFKRECWQIDGTKKEDIRNVLETKLEFLFKALKVDNTRELVDNVIKPPEIHKKLDDFCKNP